MNDLPPPKDDAATDAGSTKRKKPGANDPCPCGSGKKFKKCCRDKPLTYTSADRHSTFEKLDFFVDELTGDEEDLAYEEFWGRYLDREDELPPDPTRASNDVYEMWFAFDRVGDDGSLPVDQFLEHVHLTSGERAFLAALRRSSMRLYEVADAVPGVSLTLRDVVEGDVMTVSERSASRSIDRHEFVAARVVPRGPSGGPEIEAGLLHIPRLIKQGVLEQLREHRQTFLRENPMSGLDAFYKTMPPFFHDAWVGCILEPPVPELRNTDGEEMIPTRIHFEVIDAGALSATLDRHPELVRASDASWSWERRNATDQTTLLGRVEHRGDALVVETDSVERGARARSLVEAAGGRAILHRATKHENLRRSIQDAVREKYLSGKSDEKNESDAGRLPPAVAEALVLEHYAKHYRAWVDEPVPALQGRTPRQASADPMLRPRVEDLIHSLESMYQGALRRREPAYDPSWMWSELGLLERECALRPPPLAHERVAEKVPGSGEVSRSAAERIRRQPGFSDASSVLSREAFGSDIELQRFLRDLAQQTGPEGASVALYLRLMVNLELHRRKSFWVDEALSYMLSHTDLDVVGRELRVPFASFALVFTDRHTLSLAERALAMRDACPLSGQILRIATVYVTEERRGADRSLEICFALDALGSDLPELVRHEIPLGDDTPVQTYLDEVAPLPAVEPAIPDASPIRGLLRAAVHAILYATSAGVEPVRRSPAEEVTRHRRGTFSSDEVYFLPGAIDITQVRRMQDLERVPSGREILRRYMVRGHWRRAQQNWSDRRLRWIAPYWKGPDMAAIIERAYRLKP